MSENAVLKNDATSVITTLTEGFNCLQSEVRLLREMLSSLLSTEKGNIPEDQEWLTLEQLTEYIPGRPSIPTLRRWIKQEGLPGQKIKRKLVFQKSTVDEWLKSRTVRADNVLEKKANDYLKTAIKTHLPPWRKKKSVS